MCMGGDLQDPPAIIPRMIEAWRNGARVVIAQRKRRQEHGWRRISFRVFYAVFHKLSGGLMPRDSGRFGLVDHDRLGYVPLGLMLSFSAGMAHPHGTM